MHRSDETTTQPHDAPDAPSVARSRIGHPAVRWALASLPIAPIAVCVYLFSEWLFIITKPSPTGGLPWTNQVLVLLQSPLPMLLPVLVAQALASALATLRYPRLRGIALIPGAVVVGMLLLLLTDNFTYTVFGFGVLTAGSTARVLYCVLLAGLMTAAAFRLFKRFERVFHHRWPVAAGLVFATIVGASPVADLVARRDRVDANAPPPADGGSLDRGSLPNILFLGIDGIDAQMLSAYGYAWQTSPFLEQVREDSLFFENAFSNVAKTHGSLVTLLSGRLPFNTRVTFPPTVLQGEAAHWHLPALLKRLGYSTLQLGMRHYADAESANLLGFDAANYRWQQNDDGDAIDGASGATTETDVFRREVAERLNERLWHLLGIRPAADAFAHVEGREESPLWRDARRVDTLVRYIADARRPWFVHLHLLDTHCCEYKPDRVHFTSEQVGRWAARDSQVRETDSNVRKIFDALAAAGILDRTIVVISSDHTSEWKTTGRVPLMMRFPGARLKGRVRQNVQTADVAPTILGYLGQPIPSWMDGMSLVEPERIPHDRPILGVSNVARRQFIHSELKVLTESGAPNYGAVATTLITGDRWFEMSLIDGAMRSGAVAGHTESPSRTHKDDGSDAGRAEQEHARLVIMKQLDAAGFRIKQSTPAAESWVDQPALKVPLAPRR